MHTYIYVVQNYNQLIKKVVGRLTLKPTQNCYLYSIYTYTSWKNQLQQDGCPKVMGGPKRNLASISKIKLSSWADNMLKGIGRSSREEGYVLNEGWTVNMGIYELGMRVPLDEEACKKCWSI